MSAKQARIVVCDRELAPNLPSVIVEIDDHLYIDIDTAARTVQSFLSQSDPYWLVNLKLVRWFWHYNQLKAPKYYCPAMETILVNWATSHVVNNRLKYKAAWEAIAEEVFSETRNKPVIFPVDFGTHDVALAAYYTSFYQYQDKEKPLQWKKERFLRQQDNKMSMGYILSQSLATTAIYELNCEIKSWDYKLYSLYRRLFNLLCND